ncbi:septal ring lytic transglycosylase RlpA family protein [Terriglobus roseus]|uniref:Probable endolytic peptidoglycan transglycosylase RlpA n=1 Tax=Terriglobus roseus TaxID=392734 RepID=A0A1G7P3B3_9BACT|nr:septal ring lytic transglycosylase RlpA family protein [Terriglobus roseus]SDF80724.1 rare lipoprotein A [Terriglobus roseus]
MTASVNPSKWQRAGLVFASLLLVLLTTGCHHKTKVSRNYPPPPPSHNYPPSTASSRPLPSYATPPPNWNDNALAPRDSSVEVGLASWYGPPYHNRQAANGQPYDQNAMTAAHRTLPMGTTVRVTNTATNQSVVVIITDRGPFVHGRVLDLSLAAAKATGVYRAGVTQVRIEVLQQRAGVSPTGKWCVQIGAFQDARNALRLQNDLQRRYSTAKVLEFQGPTGHWVRINPVGYDKRQAVAIADTLRTAEPDALPYLVRLD